MISKMVIVRKAIPVMTVGLLDSTKSAWVRNALMLVGRGQINVPLTLIVKLTPRRRPKVVLQVIALTRVVLPVVLDVRLMGELVVKKTVFLIAATKMVIATGVVMGINVKTMATAVSL